jgi:hypothetical protein
MVRDFITADRHRCRIYIPLKRQVREASKQTELAAKQLATASAQAETASIEASDQRKWKKAEYLDIFAQRFFEEPDCDKVIKLLDWDERVFEIKSSNGKSVLVRIFHNNSGRYADIAAMSASTGEIGNIENTTLPCALRKHDETTYFTDAESAVRDIFDTFLFGLDKFYFLIASGLYKFDEIDIYIKYILDLATGRRSSAELANLVRDYATNYGFEGALKLIDLAKERRPPLGPAR